MRLPPDHYTQRRYPEDSCPHLFQSVGIPAHALRPKELSKGSRTVLQGFNFTFVYLDNILVASYSKSEHRVHIRQVLECSQQYDLIFVQVSVRPAGDRFPWPPHHQTGRNSTALQGGLHQGVYQATDNQGIAVAHWHGKFFPPVCASSSKHSATCLPIPHSEAHGTTVERGDGNSIQSCKVSTSQWHLAHPPTADATTDITLNVSGVAVGAALKQLVHGSWQPLAFFTRQLRPSEWNYSAFDRQLFTYTSQSDTSSTFLRRESPRLSQTTSHSHSPSISILKY